MHIDDKIKRNFENLILNIKLRKKTLFVRKMLTVF